MTPETETLYMAGFNASINRYRGLLAGVDSGQLNLPNDNFDVGGATKAGGYSLADGAYALLLRKLDGRHADMPEDLRSDILAFYHDLTVSIATNANRADWARLRGELDHLRAVDRDMSGIGFIAK